VGTVRVAGMTPVEAAQRIETALKDGQYLVDPHVTLTVTQSHSQRVSVLGEVHTPARFSIEPNTSVFDLLALAGGVTENSSDTVYVMRPQPDGSISRIPVDLKSLAGLGGSLPTQTLQGGDSLYIPRAEQFYIYGEVAAPNKYRIESGMTVIQAIARAGGITPRGSERRVDIKRKADGGKYLDIHAKPGDLVHPEDVIRVKESIF
jgi:polysaccharide export outer membrane protein